MNKRRLLIVDDDTDLRSALISQIEPDPFHPLASVDVQTAAFLVRRPTSRAPQTLTLTCDGEIFRVEVQ